MQVVLIVTIPLCVLTTVTVTVVLRAVGLAPTHVLAIHLIPLVLDRTNSVLAFVGSFVMACSFVISGYVPFFHVNFPFPFPLLFP